MFDPKILSPLDPTGLPVAVGRLWLGGNSAFVLALDAGRTILRRNKVFVAVFLGGNRADYKYRRKKATSSQMSLQTPQQPTFLLVGETLEHDH